MNLVGTITITKFRISLLSLFKRADKSSFSGLNFNTHRLRRSVDGSHREFYLSTWLFEVLGRLVCWDAARA